MLLLYACFGKKTVYFGVRTSRNKKRIKYLQREEKKENKGKTEK